MSMTLKQLLSIVLPEIDELSREQRVEFLNKIRKKYCMHCGKNHEDSIFPCSCWNDE